MTETPPQQTMSDKFNLSSVSQNEFLVKVGNLPTDCDAQSVRDFFSFCGAISDVQVIDAGPGLRQGLIVFQQPSAASTALALTNAVLNGRAITVTNFDLKSEPLAAKPEEACRQETAEPATPECTDEAGQQQQQQQQNGSRVQSPARPISKAVAGFLAAGYKMTQPVVQPVVHRGLALDDKYRVRKSLVTMLDTAQARATQLDQRFRVVERLRGIDDRFNLTTNASAAISRAKALGERALSTPAGQIVLSTVNTARDLTLEVAWETRARVLQMQEQEQLQEQERQKSQDPNENASADSLQQQQQQQQQMHLQGEVAAA